MQLQQQLKLFLFCGICRCFLVLGEDWNMEDWFWVWWDFFNVPRAERSILNIFEDSFTSRSSSLTQICQCTTRGVASNSYPHASKAKEHLMLLCSCSVRNELKPVRVPKWVQGAGFDMVAWTLQPANLIYVVLNWRQRWQIVLACW